VKRVAGTTFAVSARWLHNFAGWRHNIAAGSWYRQLAAQSICLLALPGVAAVMEFAGRGLGTPTPYDPPKRLVTSGVYRYCANPNAARVRSDDAGLGGSAAEWMAGAGGGDFRGVQRGDCGVG
jgi:hypothetical protein